MTVSEFEHVLGIAKDGTYRIMNAPEKVLFTGPMIYGELFDPEKGQEFIVVYRDKKKMAFAKKIKIEKFIRNREYRLIKDKGGRVDLLLPPDALGTVHMDFVPAKRQRLKEADFELAELDWTSPTARGVRMAPKPVGKVKLIAAPESGEKNASAKKAAKGKAGKRDGNQGDLF